MSGKKFAARAGTAFLALLLACTFFSKSFSAYLTPKVTVVKPQPGILPKELKMDGVFDAPQKTEMTLEEAKANPVRIASVKAKRGDRVKAGDLLMTADAGEAPRMEAEKAEKELESLRIAVEDWKYQLESAKLDLERQIDTHEEQNSTLKQDLQVYTARVKRENGSNPLLESAENKLALAKREYQLLDSRKKDQEELDLLDLDRQISGKEEAAGKTEKALAELEGKLESDPEAKYQQEKLKRDLEQARTELSLLAAEYGKQYDSLNAANKRQISQKKDEIHQLLTQISALSAISKRSSEEDYQLYKALEDVGIAQEELKILQNSLGSASNSTLVNIQGQINGKQDEVHSLEQKLKEAEDEAKNQREKEAEAEKAKKELELAQKELSQLRKERLKQSETNRINLEKQLLDKEKEVGDLQDSVNKQEGTSDTLRLLEKTQEELKINEKEQKLLAEKKKELAGGTWQGKTGEMQQKELETAEEKAKEARRKLEGLTQIRAARDGVIAELGAQEGDTYRGDKPICVIMPSEVLEIRAVIPDASVEDIKTGMECTISERGRSGNAKVAGIDERAKDGGTEYIAVIQVEQNFFRFYNDPLALKGRPVQVSVSYNEGFSPAILPNSAIFEEESGKRVYLVKKREGFWGEEFYIEKAQVILLDYNSKSSSVQGVSMNETVVTGWDRPLEDGQQVICLQD